MASSISSLGLGSDGVLSYDIIDKLKAVDEKTQLDPIDAKLTTNKSKHPMNKYPKKHSHRSQ